MFSTFSGSFWAGRRASTSKSGSWFFPGGNNQFLRVTHSSDFAPGLSDFTIELWYYASSYVFAPRLFSIGTYATSPNLAVSLEGSNQANKNLMFWTNGNQVSLGTTGPTLNQWNHIAIVRASGTVKAYINGVNISGAGLANTDDIGYDPLEYFIIGSESLNGTSAFGNVTFAGYMSNFHFVNGTALYTSDFTPDMNTIVAMEDTKLLLTHLTSATALIDHSGNNVGVVAAGSGSWNSTSPFN